MSGVRQLSTAEVQDDVGSYGDWMKQVDAYVIRRVGVSVHDLPDCTFRDWHEDGVSAAEAATRAIAEMLE